MKRNFCVRSTANAGTITLPPRSMVFANQAARAPGADRYRDAAGCRRSTPSRARRRSRLPVARSARPCPGAISLSRTRPMSPVKSNRRVCPFVCQRDFRHARAQNVRGSHEAERKLRAQLRRLPDHDWLEDTAGSPALLRACTAATRDRASTLFSCCRTRRLLPAGVRNRAARPSTDRWSAAWRRSDPRKPFFHQAWNPATVIEVRVRENDGINFARRDRSVLPVALAPFFLSLKKAAVDQNLDSLLAARIVGGVDQVLRAGHGPGCAEKLDVGQEASVENQSHKSDCEFSLCRHSGSDFCNLTSDSLPSCAILNHYSSGRFPAHCRR